MYTRGYLTFIRVMWVVAIVGMVMAALGGSVLPLLLNMALVVYWAWRNDTVSKALEAQEQRLPHP